MDELKVRVYIQKLTKKLIPEFDKVLDSKERIKLVLNEPIPEFLDLENFQNYIHANWPRKNERLSAQNREDGNTAFQSGNHELAVVLYTEAMKYSPVDCTLKEGEAMAIAVANRSASHFQLKEYSACLLDIDLAVEAGYPTELIYKLYIRQCKCLLELGKISEAQAAFDRAIDAIDRSGMKKDARKGMAANLQEAFINLAKSVEENPPPPTDDELQNSVPEWAKLKEPHPNYPSASSAITIKYDPLFGRHVVANRTIEVGEVIFNEEPIVSTIQGGGRHVDREIVSTPSCHNCLRYIKSGLVPCPTCNIACFCSLKCRDYAMSSHHQYECKLSLFFEETELNRLPLAMMAFRAVTQKPLEFFITEYDKGKFDQHNTQNGVINEKNDNEDKHNLPIYHSNDYLNLFNLVTHSERRDTLDIVTKNVFAGILLQCLEAAGYFKSVDKDAEAKDQNNPGPSKERLVIGYLLAHFLQCFQFNTHMVESVFSNRLIAPDAETRMWKDARYFQIGEFVETHPVGGGIYPTMANVNHSCDPNFVIINYLGRNAVAVADRRIEAGEEIHDTYGSVYFHMERSERQHYLNASHWFTCSCKACSNNWSMFSKLPREYLKLPGTHFKYKRCNRKELQKDVDRIKRRIQAVVNKAAQAATSPSELASLEEQPTLEVAVKMYCDWSNLLSELLYVPGHRDFVNVRRGIKNCLWLHPGSTNIVKVKEDDALRKTKSKFRDSEKKVIPVVSGQNIKK